MIYYFLDDTMPLYALLVYAKNVKDDMSFDEKQVISKLVETLKVAWEDRDE